MEHSVQSILSSKHALMKLISSICLFTVIALSCRDGYHSKYPYTIKGYSDILQPYSVKALTLGMPAYHNTFHTYLYKTSQKPNH